MQISRTLNVVVPVDREDGTTSFVHSTPITRETFERNYMVIAKTFASIYSEGLGVMAGPRVSAMILRNVAREMKLLEGVDGVEFGLIGEIKRLSMYVGPVPGQGVSKLMVEEALSQNLITPDEWSEVENALVFFTVVSWMQRRKDREDALSGLSALWGAQITSSNSTEWMPSFPTSTPPDNTGAKKAGLSVPV